MNWKLITIALGLLTNITWGQTNVPPAAGFLSHGILPSPPAAASTNPAAPQAASPAEAPAAPPLSARDQFELGVQFMREKKYASAAEAFATATAAKPDFAEAYNNWGISLVQLGKQSLSPQQQAQQYQLAAEKFSKATQLRPDQKVTYLLWSETLVLIGDLPLEGRVRLACYQGAVEKCRKAVELAPQEWESYNKWAAILSTKLVDFAPDDKTRVQLYRDAANLFAQAADRARFSGELGPVYANWGSALMRAARLTTDSTERSKLLDAAIEKFERSARAIANAAPTYSMWGSALIERSKLTRARNDLREGVDRLNTSLSLNPNDSATLYNLAGAYALMNNNVLAVQTLKKCFEADASKQYSQLAPTDPDLSGLRTDPLFLELFNTGTRRGLPAYNPPLRDVPR